MEKGSAAFPTSGILPKEETQAADFVRKYPEYDGRGVVVAIFDSGVDPGAPGLQTTSDGKRKIIDIIDASGGSDVDMSVTRTAVDGHIEGLSGRKLKLGQWDNPTGTYRVGLKAAYDFFPQDLVERLKGERKSAFDKKHRIAVDDVTKALENTKLSANEKKELEAKKELLGEVGKSWSDLGPVYDCVLFQDSKGTWRAVLDKEESGDLTNAKVLADYAVEFEFDTFSKEDLLNYSVKIYDNGNVLSVVANSGSHGTHVAGIVAANYPEEPALNGVAPGAQIIAVKIGDSRLGTMETGPALVRAILAMSKSKPDLINMSYGEPSARANAGRVMDLANQLVELHGVTFVSSAGNNGPAYTTTGAPGGNACNLIGVGAMVTPGMMDVAYSMFETLPETQYTWSSRGPSEDGSLGVSISAPGGAIAPVPNYQLKKKQLMNGTSMSSPNACGCLALVISALKHQKIPYTPFSLKRASENTARPIENVERLAQGYGLIQVNEAFEYSKKTAEIAHLRLDVKFPQRNNARGLYVREAWEFNSQIEKNMEVVPVFSKSISNTDKVQFEIKLNVKCTIPGVKVAEHLVLMAESRSMKVSADPSLFPEGKVVHGEILFTDSAKPELGPLLRVPLTFIKPASLKEHTLQSGAPIKFTPGHVERRFIHVPEHATWAEVTVQANKFENNKLMLIVAYPYLKQWSSRNVDETYFWIQGDEKYVWPIRVHGGQPLEFDVGQSWSSLGSSGDVTFKIEFHGVNVPPQLHLGPGDKLVRCDVATHLREEEIAPTAKLGVIRKTLRPTSSQIKTACPDRDIDMDGQQIYEMTLSYTYEHVNETAYKVITRVVGLSEYLYESPHEAQFWMVFDQNKKLIAKGDAWPKAFSVPAKGTYTVRVLMRSVSSKTLESMKDWPLFVDIQVPKDKQVAVDIFSTFDGALTSGAKVKTVKMAKGRVNTLWFKAPEDSAVSGLNADKGDLLLGRVSWKKLEGEEPAMYGSQGINLHEGETSLSFTYSVNGKSSGSSSSSAAQKFVPDDKKSALENHADFLASESLQYALKLSGDKEFDGAKAVLGSVKVDKDTQPGLHLNHLHALLKVAVAEKSAKAGEVSLNDAVMSAADNLIAAVDTTKLAAYKNAKDPALAGFDAKLWALTDTVYTDALYLKANALLETLLAKEAKNELANEDKETYNKVYEVLKKQFPNLESDSKYAKFVVFSEKFSGHSFNAMTVLLKKWNSPLNKEALSTVISLLEQAGMTDEAQYYRKLLLVSFPEKYQLLA